MDKTAWKEIRRDTLPNGGTLVLYAAEDDRGPYAVGDWLYIYREWRGQTGSRRSPRIDWPEQFKQARATYNILVLHADGSRPLREVAQAVGSAVAAAAKSATNDHSLRGIEQEAVKRLSGLKAVNRGHAWAVHEWVPGGRVVTGLDLAVMAPQNAGALPSYHPHRFKYTEPTSAPVQVECEYLGKSASPCWGQVERYEVRSLLHGRTIAFRCRGHATVQYTPSTLAEDRMAGRPLRQLRARLNPGVEAAPELVAGLPSLPDQPYRYFKNTLDSFLVPIGKLETIRARPQGVLNAAKYMRMAYDGQMERRKPIDLEALPSGAFRVLDGNSTVNVARAAGWQCVVGRVVAGNAGIGAVVENPRRGPSRRRGGVRNPGNPSVSALSDQPLTFADYPGVFGDPDNDALPTVDDPHPNRAGDVESVEEVRLAEEIAKLIDLRTDLTGVKNDVLERLRKFGGARATAIGRAKTPYSMINKMIRKRLIDEKHGLHDLIGTSLIYPDGKAVRSAVRRILAGGLGLPAVLTDDFYAHPNNGYRAYHLEIQVPISVPNDRGGRKTVQLPVELQVKSKRMKVLSAAAHEGYKRGRLNGAELNRLSDLAARADDGDRAAAALIDAVLRQGEHALEQRLTLQS